MSDKIILVSKTGEEYKVLRYSNALRNGWTTTTYVINYNGKDTKFMSTDHFCARHFRIGFYACTIFPPLVFLSIFFGISFITSDFYFPFIVSIIVGIILLFIAPFLIFLLIVLIKKTIIKMTVRGDDFQQNSTKVTLG